MSINNIMSQTEILTAPIADAIILHGIVDRPSACGASIFESMKEIKLSQTGKNKGKYVALVDDEDYEYLSQFKWYANVSPNGNIYAMRGIWQKGQNWEAKEMMHRVIMKTPDHLLVDHVFHNTLDNRKFIEINGKLKCNLRNCTELQNNWNRLKQNIKNKSSQFMGVSYRSDSKRRKRYKAMISVKGRRIHLGTYKTEIEAALVRDKAAKKYFGEFANLNFKDK